MKIKKNNVKTIFGLYMVCLFNFVVLKFFGNVNSIVERVQNFWSYRNEGHWNINLKPSIISTINFYLRNSLFDISTIYFLFNIIIFIPLGFLLPLLKVKPSLLKTLRDSFFIILSIESIQFITCLGIFDVDDIILNIFGSFIGYTFYLIYKKLKK